MKHHVFTAGISAAACLLNNVYVCGLAGTKRPSQASVIARLTQQTQKGVDTKLLNHGAACGNNKEYWRTVAVPLEAHMAAARRGLIVPDALQGSFVLK